MPEIHGWFNICKLINEWTPGHKSHDHLNRCKLFFVKRKKDILLNGVMAKG